MPDLADDQTVEIQGSAARPYVLKNVGGVYSCSCPAWRNQSLPIDRRSCKHLRSYFGEAAEAARVGGILPASAATKLAKPTVPPLLLAETWTDDVDPSGFWLSEKLDGVRAWWDGTRFLSRNGNCYFAPEWFTAGLPNIPLDGELWIGRKQFQQTVAVVRRQNGGDAWRRVRYVVFDAPQVGGPFEDRLSQLNLLVRTDAATCAEVLGQTVCRDRRHLAAELARIEQQGGEGLMLRQPGSLYVPARSATLLKLKSFRDCEATVVGHQPGTGRHRGRLGALLVRLASGTECAVGTGLSDAERELPPSIGSVITLKYQELTDAGVPRFPAFIRVRGGSPAPISSPSKGTLLMPTRTASSTRRFEFVEGTSSKFWEVRCDGSDVLVRFGRIGSTGQTLRKPFGDAAAAERHVEKLIAEKTGKGYREVAS